MELDGIPLIVSRTGWSSELGYEIYLRDGTRGDELWEKIMAAGLPFGLAPGHTSSIRRIEAGMLSYHSDMDIHTNPYELGLGRLVDLDMDADYVGKAALTRIASEGVSRLQVGLEIETDPLPEPNNEYWPLSVSGQCVGRVTSAIYSPRLESNIALAMVQVDHSAIGTQLEVDMPGAARTARIVPKPFYDPGKNLPKK
jgi:aminomethyltransferase